MPTTILVLVDMQLAVGEIIAPGRVGQGVGTRHA